MIATRRDEHGRIVRLRRWLTREQRLFGASLVRIGLGGVVLYQLLGRWTERRFLWGPRGVYPTWLFDRDLPSMRGPSLFAVDSIVLFEALFATTVVVTGLFLVGWRTRWMGISLYVLLWSLVKRNPMLTTGGDTLVLVTLPFLAIMNTSAYLSADSRWRATVSAPPPAAQPFAALLHNVGLCCVLLQLCVFYGSAGAYKLFGETWRSGTAIYYALRLPEFELPGASPQIYGNPTVVALLTYGTLAFELSYPALIWSRRTRWIAAAQAVVFHAGIGMVMGLVTFAAQAIAFQLLLFDDAQYAALGRRLRGRRGFRG